MRIEEILNEAYDTSKARIDHPEDLVISNASSGAMLAVKLLNQAIKNSNTISIKPDGKPAIKWGRDSQGFAMGDKYMKPLPHSAEEMQELLSKRRGGANPHLVKLYNSLWNTFRASVPNINGFLFGDLMYSSPPPQQNGQYVIKPNTVEYTVPVDSELGRRIAASRAGIVVHTYLPVGSDIGKHVASVSKIPGVDVSGPLLMIDDSLSQVLKLNPVGLEKVQALIGQHKSKIDEFLNESTLAEKKIKGMRALMIKFVNEKVKQGNFDNMPVDFFDWLKNNSSEPMARKIQEHAAEHELGYKATWAVFRSIVDAKQGLIHQLDQVKGNMTAHVNGQAGHEGYVVHSSQGPVKLVDRFKFSAANFGA